MTRADVSRIPTIDLARGMAMVFVCLAHFVDGLREYPSGVVPLTLAGMGRLSMLASPTFVIVSGLTVGLLAVRSGSRFPAVRLKLIDRSLFTLTIGHLLLVLVEGSLVGHFQRELRTVFITDVVALSTLLGVVLVSRVPATLRLALASTLFVTGWLVWLLWQPHGLALQVTGEVLAGPHRTRLLGYGFPILMWVGVHQAATVLGEWLARRSVNNLPRVAPVMASAGAASLLVGAFVKLLLPLLPSSSGALLPMLVSATQKLPPSPVYLLVNGGAGLLLIGLAASGSLLPRWVAGGLCRVGRASFFTYVVQYAIFTTAVPLLGLPVGRAWPIYFLVLLAVTFALGLRWEAIGGNRFLTVGLQHAGRLREA